MIQLYQLVARRDLIDRIIMEYKSEQINELAGALAKAQAEMPVAELNNSNPYFKSKYADLATYVKASRPFLSKYGLSVSQLIMFDTCGEQFLQTMLLHSSGQFISSFAKINPQKTDIQSLGSYLTYIRRYSYAAIIGCASGADDDDGESTMQRSQSYASRQDVKLSNEQVSHIEDLLIEAPELKATLLSVLRIQSFHYLPVDKYDKTIQWIESQLSK